MRSIARALAISLIVTTLSGCLYADVRLPLDRDLDKTELGSKIGLASSESALWLFAWGDASTRAAAENGKIDIINHLDVQQKVILFGLYTKTTTIAYGD